MKGQLPLSSWAEQHLRTVRLVKDAYSSSYSEWNADEKWSSQEWKSDEVMEVRRGDQLMNNHRVVLVARTFFVDDDDMDSNTVAESNMSLKSRSFLHTVHVRVRKMRDQSSKDATQDRKKHSFIRRMLSSTLEASVFMGKGYSEIYAPSKT